MLGDSSKGVKALIVVLEQVVWVLELLLLALEIVLRVLEVRVWC